MPEHPPIENAPKPPPRDLLREARRLARLQHLRVVRDEPQFDPARVQPDPKEAA